MRASSALLAALALLAAGCDVFGSNRTVAEGTVIDARTKAPIEGIVVSLVVWGGIVPAPVAATTSDAKGRFRVSASRERTGAGCVTLWAHELTYEQEGVYDERYGGYNDCIGDGERTRRTVELLPLDPP